MASSSFYKISLKESELDLTDLVESLKYEDSITEDDLVTITIPRTTLEMVDSDDIKKGREIIFEYGILGGKRSGKRHAVIKNINYDYGASISITIMAHDKGSWMKKSTNTQVFENKTASDIVKLVAKMFGMEAVVDDTEKVYESMPQAGRTYYDFCRHLAAKEGFVKTESVFKDKSSSAIAELNKIAALRFGINDFYNKAINPATRRALTERFNNGQGNAELETAIARAEAIYRVAGVGKTYIKGGYEFYVRGTVMYFVKRDMSTDSKTTFTYGDPDGPVRSFKPKDKEKGNGSGATSGIKSTGIDPETNEIFVVETSKENETGLGDELLHFDVNGELLDVPGIESDTKAGSTSFIPGGKEEVQQRAAAKKIDANKNEVKATLVLDFSPEIDAGDIITMAGVARIHAGNWRVEKASHDIASSAPQTVLDLVKNAGKKGGGGATDTKSNQSVGQGDGSESETDVVYFDANGFEIGKKESGYGVKGSKGGVNASGKVNNL